MSGRSRHRHQGRHQSDRSRSPRYGRGSDHESSIILPDVVVDVLEKEQDDIFKKLQDTFPNVRVTRRNSKLTFIGSPKERVDSMMYLYRYLKNKKKVEFIRSVD